MIILLNQGMDISDIELVIVYGTPSSLSHLYQVVRTNNMTLTCIFIVVCTYLISFLVEPVVEAVNQGHTCFIVQSKKMSMLKLRLFVTTKKIVFVVVFCVPLEMIQVLIKAGFAVVCVVIHNSPILSSILNDMPHPMVEKEGDVQQYGM